MEGTEKNVTSSMTSVTEEDTSEESDTTESYTSSNITSSVISSTDYSTDDKLTPGLNNIKISKRKCDSSYFNINNSSQFTNGNISENKNAEHTHPPFSMPYGVFDGSNIMETDKKKTKVEQSLLKKVLTQHRSKRTNGWFASAKGMEENLGLTDPDDKIDTDFSDTSSRPEETLNDCETEEIFKFSDRDSGPSSFDWTADSEQSSLSDSNRPLLPDMSSSMWYRAQCFDHYWATYSFAMDWYKQHMQAVANLSSGQPPGKSGSKHGVQLQKGKKSRRARKCQRAKVRKAFRASQANRSHDDRYRTYKAPRATGSDEDQSDIEMEISDEMMAFFATSMKHRIERDNEKNLDEGAVMRDRVEPSQVATVSSPTVSAPTEQPGVRRTSEMRSLYGTGAPMVHGMETALQMTFDRITDRHQPKLWPNMPLKIVFQ